MTRNMKLTVVSLLALSVIVVTTKVYAIGTTGDVNATVIAALAITNSSALDFGEGIQGDVAKVVAPGAAENASNGSFAITGEPNRAYTITLPADGAVVMATAGGGVANKEIAVDSFVSNPAAGANGLLDGSGAQDVFVGATRAALLANQVTGSYTTTYTVTVVY
ncbi:MAG: hypothetical protein A2428_09140 [Bdellovibrionales bacterium RIFOXYC1_FULL_54_43]|nr:MAG: hypothetical protein A2428_09140 [Bdellovibrionales bacterium RIFOXYC1_FULL_54_43]OFZ82999.1 MAG: hypothetical protein A2603_02715 [Bdellovibrionales bacterium RIFOXYD1_FULL_55_31]